MGEAMKLYGMPGAGQIICACVIAELGLECEPVFVDDSFRDSAEFRAISPYGRVPVLVPDQGPPIFESMAITLHLLDHDHENRLRPSPETPEYGRFLSWMAYLATTFYNACLRAHYPERYGEAKSVNAMAEEELDRIYDHLESEAGQWVAGDRMTAADYYLYMLMGWDEGEGCKKRLECHPKLARINAAVGGLETVRQVMAVHGD